MRAIFILTGAWGDFIPKIGMWLLNTHQPDWLIGYLWRYIGDGGFMALAFVVALANLFAWKMARKFKLALIRYCIFG